MTSPCALILPAAGRSTRFGGPRGKLLEKLGDRCVVAWSVGAFLQRSDIAQAVIATFDEAPIRAALAAAGLPLERVCFCPGGTCRAGSVLNALKCVDANITWVAVHDAARPLVSQELIDRTLAAAREHGAAAVASAVHLTIKQAAGPLPAPVQRTIDRQTLWAMQTPQIMRRADLLEAFARCPIPLERVTDDIQVLELVGKEVWLVEGEERNLKITTPLDLRLAREMAGLGRK
jgi:2-C-methyl-D-erythritol 4-phosphate cytidylyltransferase